MKLQIGHCLLDLERGTFHRAGELVSLRPKTFSLLAHFVRNPDRLLTKAELLDAVWPETTVTEESLTQCVRDLRKAIGDERQETVRTVARRGYLFQQPKDGVAQAAVSRPAEPLVAVLPFRRNFTEGAVVAVLDGVVEEITNALSCFRTVAVFARHSAFELARMEQDESHALIARFGIDYLVEGTLDDAAGGLRVTVTLSEAATGKRVWAHAFPLAHDAALSVPATIAQHIITTLASNIESAAMQRLAGAPAGNMAAYGHLLHGMAALRSYGAGVNEQARDHFVEAVRLDPLSGLAHAYLALAEMIIGGYATAAQDVLEAARDTAVRAVALAPNEARCHRILALILLYCRDFDASGQHFERALDINPYDADTLMQKGFLLAVRGNPQAGILLADRAIRLNPLHPPWYHYDRAEILFAHRRYREAAAALSCLPRKDAWHWARLAAAHAMDGEQQRAASSVAEGLRLEPALTIDRILLDVEAEGPDGVALMRKALEKAGWPVHETE